MFERDVRGDYTTGPRAYWSPRSWGTSANREQRLIPVEVHSSQPSSTSAQQHPDVAYDEGVDSVGVPLAALRS